MAEIEQKNTWIANGLGRTPLVRVVPLVVPLPPSVVSNLSVCEHRFAGCPTAGRRRRVLTLLRRCGKKPLSRPLRD